MHGLVRTPIRKWLSDHGALKKWEQQYAKSIAEISRKRLYSPSELRDPRESATVMSRDSGYASMISKKLPETSSYDDADSRSIASLESHNTLASSLNTAGLGGAAEEFAGILLDKDEILQCLKQGFEADSAGFERQFNRLLRDYASELGKEAETPLEKSATRIVYSYRAYVVRIIRTQIIGSAEEDGMATAFHSIKTQAMTKLTLERFLAQQQPSTHVTYLDERPEEELESSGDSASDDEQPSLPNLEKLTSFLVTSVAFKNFKDQLELLVNTTTEVQDIILPISSVKNANEDPVVERQKYPGFLKKARNVVLRLFQPSIPSGSRRIEWMCDCGDLLHMDFNGSSVESFPTIMTLLGFKSLPSGSAQISNPPQSSAPSIPIQTHLAGNLSQNSATQTSPVSGSNSSVAPQISQAAVVAASTSQSPSKIIFLELCVNSGAMLKSLAEIDVTSITTDSDFFSTVKAHYLRLRSFRVRFWLLKPVSVSYVRFSVEDRHRVGILHKPIALPPKPEVDAKRYHYDPCPLDNELPISSDLCLHYLFSCSSPSKNLIWFPRIPRKLDISILTSPAPASFGWGVHIDEGPDYFKIFSLNLVVLGLSALVAFLWGFYKHDVQGAMGLAAWTVMLLNTIMAVFVAKWSQELWYLKS